MSAMSCGDPVLLSITKRALFQDLSSASWARCVRQHADIGPTDEPPEALQQHLSEIAINFLSLQFPPFQISNYVQHALSSPHLLYPSKFLQAYFDAPSEQLARFLLSSFSVVTLPPPLDLDILQLAFPALINELESKDRTQCIKLNSKLVLLFPGYSQHSFPAVAQHSSRLLSEFAGRLSVAVKEHLYTLTTPSTSAIDASLPIIESAFLPTSEPTDVDEASLEALGPCPDVHLALSFIMREQPDADCCMYLLRGLFSVRTGNAPGCVAEILLAVTSHLNPNSPPSSLDEWRMRSWLFCRFPKLFSALDLDHSQCGYEGLALFLRIKSRIYLQHLPTLGDDTTLPECYEKTQEFNRISQSFLQSGLASLEQLQDLAPLGKVTDVQEPSLAEVREHFNSQLTAPEKIETYLSESKESYDKQDLVAQIVCERIETLRKSKDLHGLSSFLTILSKDPIVLAVFFVHVDPVQLMTPVRTFIDEFQMTSDYGDESAIEMYGRVSMFFHVVVHRYQLADDRKRHLGTTKGFCYQWLASWSHAYSLDSLHENLVTALGNWISALFGDGISDELISSTSPRTLLVLAPTLVRQCLLAYVQGGLDETALKSGLSYFGQDILRFTLPSILKWLITEILRQDDVTNQYTTTALDILKNLMFAEWTPPEAIELVAMDLLRLSEDARFATISTETFDINKLREKIGVAKAGTTAATADAAAAAAATSNPQPSAVPFHMRPVDSLSVLMTTLPLMVESKWQRDAHSMLVRAIDIYGDRQTLKSILNSLLAQAGTSVRHSRFLVALICHPIGNPPVLLNRLVKDLANAIASGQLSVGVSRLVTEIMLRMEKDDERAMLRGLLENEIGKEEMETKFGWKE